MGQVVDWNCGGGADDELAVSTKDGYELYAQKHENVYTPKFKQFVGFKKNNKTKKMSENVKHLIYVE